MSELTTEAAAEITDLDKLGPRGLRRRRVSSSGEPLHRRDAPARLARSTPGGGGAHITGEEARELHELETKQAVTAA